MWVGAVVAEMGAVVERKIRPTNMTTRARLLVVFMFKPCSYIYCTLMVSGGGNKGVFS